MWGFVARMINRRCRLCGIPVAGKGVRLGWRTFCSPAHQQEYREEQELKRLAVSRMMKDMMKHRRGGCC